MLTIEEALRQVLALAPDPLGAEWLPLAQIFGRISATGVTSTRDLPGFDNSAMDGYALRLADAKPGARLRVVGEVAAGDQGRTPIEAGEARRIFTGAPLPPSAELVVMQEHVNREGDWASLEESAVLEAGQHVRRRGNDVKVGDAVLPAGTLLGAGEVGLLAACGRGGLYVTRRPRVAILPSGNELVELDLIPGPGQVVNSNAAALAAMVQEAGGIATCLPIARDSKEALHEAFAAAEGYDLVLTSGGVSVGDHDLIQPVLKERGFTRSFWKVAMKPGKPVLCGRLADGARFLGLPGNPASTMVAFELFGRPLLRRLLGHPRPYRLERIVPLLEDYPKRTGRTHVVRGFYESGGFRPLQRQGSGMLRSMIGVDALALVPPELDRLVKGAPVVTLDLREGSQAQQPKLLGCEQG